MILVSFLVIISNIQLDSSCDFGTPEYDSTCCQDSQGNSMRINAVCNTPQATGDLNEKIKQLEDKIKTVERVVEHQTNGKVINSNGTGVYQLYSNFDSPASMRAGWRCYMGQTGYPAPVVYRMENGVNVGLTSMGDKYKHAFGRGWFYETGEPLQTNFNVDGIWLEDPTKGMNMYNMGCYYLSDLLTERTDGRPGFEMKAMRPSTLADVYTNVQNDDGSRWWGNLNSIYTVRMETKDVYNGGVFVLRASRLPYGSAVWPAWWMVGSNVDDWVHNPPKTTGMGLRNYWPGKGGELDIIEYANAWTKEEAKKEHRNHVTLHTLPDCISQRSFPSGKGELGPSPDCNFGSAFIGCSISMGKDTTGMPEFTGGEYVCEWVMRKKVACWFFKLDPPYDNIPEAPLAEGGKVQVVLQLTNTLAGAVPVIWFENSWSGTLQQQPNGDWSGFFGATYPDYQARDIQTSTFTFELTMGAEIEVEVTTGGQSAGQGDPNEQITTIEKQWVGNAYTFTGSVPVTVNVVPGQTTVVTYSGTIVDLAAGTSTLTTPTIQQPQIDDSPPPAPPASLPTPAYQLPNVSPLDFAPATTVNTADLGPPDILHNFEGTCDSYNALENMRQIINTVVCGQWPGNIKATQMPGDTRWPVSYDPRNAICPSYGTFWVEFPSLEALIAEDEDATQINAPSSLLASLDAGERTFERDLIVNINLNVTGKAYVVSGSKHYKASGWGSECEFARLNECIKAIDGLVESVPKQNGNRDYLPERFSWIVDFIKVYV